MKFDSPESAGRMALPVYAFAPADSTAGCACRSDSDIFVCRSATLQAPGIAIRVPSEPPLVTSWMICHHVHGKVQTVAEFRIDNGCDPPTKVFVLCDRMVPRAMAPYLH